jgi:hypothetical protein
MAAAVGLPHWAHFDLAYELLDVLAEWAWLPRAPVVGDLVPGDAPSGGVGVDVHASLFQRRFDVCAEFVALPCLVAGVVLIADEVEDQDEVAEGGLRNVPGSRAPDLTICVAFLVFARHPGTCRCSRINC